MKTRHTDTDSSETEISEHQLYEAIVAIRDIDEAKRFFEDLCTPTERQSMADRWRVVPLIEQGIPYRTIHEQTGVSVTTIGRVARCLTQGEGGYNLIHDRLKRKNRVKDNSKNNDDK
ncbi:YerC/YecD family TrpR-related protein [Candidatus Berkiella aquae]|uniref:Helix-turn-helix domain-containing protein n=1 Tax=Candidatus Berkiella aquae TaxID=295108 RepID=A0A0Q9YNX7_9GAMM|nr:YerC/YecD family TrpR-related protein [Candidatus Berkiella aquae]MCS5712142.1 helix-turn-helix domain-containing protein [Candidatus Berkiella aquae]